MSRKTKELITFHRIVTVAIATVGVLIIVVAWTALIVLNNQGILEYGHVLSFKVTERDDHQLTTLEIAGRVIDSSLGVGEITTKTEGASLAVIVHLIFAWPGASGNFKRDLVVPNSIREVRFGNDRILIWERGSGVVLQGAQF
jgi:hypothetical protein